MKTNTGMTAGKYYFHGDACEWTGVVKDVHKGRFYEYQLLEGHRKGDNILSQHIPHTIKLALEKAQ